MGHTSEAGRFDGLLHIVFAQGQCDQIVVAANVAIEVLRITDVTLIDTDGYANILVELK